MLGLWLCLWEKILMELIGVRIFVLTVDGTIPSARDPELYIKEEVSKVLIYVYQNYTLQIIFPHSVCPAFTLLVFSLWGILFVFNFTELHLSSLSFCELCFENQIQKILVYLNYLLYAFHSVLPQFCVPSLQSILNLC